LCNAAAVVASAAADLVHAFLCVVLVSIVDAVAVVRLLRKALEAASEAVDFAIKKLEKAAAKVAALCAIHAAHAAYHGYEEEKQVLILVCVLGWVSGARLTASPCANNPAHVPTHVPPPPSVRRRLQMQRRQDWRRKRS
jgi:hypothetical protein